ncbi:MAG: DUF4956 domain-containing protein [Ignavibacteriales bacterium]|nr:DUF4956 domain-containing protein [Ignavibacteriales bacterium]
MLQDFQNIFATSITLGTVLQNLSVAVLCSLLIAVFYKYSYKGPGYSASFVHSLIALSMITAIVIMVIGNNLARAFGLVGAMSIIRFRTAVKDTIDIVFIFFALGIGMAAGVGLYSVAFGGTIFIGLILLALSKTDFLIIRKEKFLLQFRYQQQLEPDPKREPELEREPDLIPAYLPVIKKFCKKFTMINVKSIGREDELELSFYVSIKNKNQNPEFIKELSAIKGISSVNFYFDDESL